LALGKRLRQAREEKGWTQTYVAKMLGLTSQALSNYERGERDPDTPLLNRLAKFYEVSTDWLLNGKSNNKSIADSHEPTHAEIEKVIRDAQINFDGAPLTDEDKEDVIGFIKMALRMKKRKQQE